MGKILIMATSDKIESLSRQFITTLPEKEQENVKVINVRLYNAVRIAQGLNPNEIDAVIVRGNTAIVLSNANLPFPVIPITVYTPEIASALQKARKLSGKEKPFVGIAGFDQSIGSISALNALLDISGIQIRYYHMYSHQDIIAAANKGLMDELDVMIGGPMCVEECKKVGLPAIELESTLASILPAYEQAREFQNALFRQQIISSEDNVISSHTKELILSVDKSGCIITSNHCINASFHIFPQFVKGDYITKHPFFEDTDLSKIEEAACNHSAILLTYHEDNYILHVAKETLKAQTEQYILSIYLASDIRDIDISMRHALYSRRKTSCPTLDELKYYGLISEKSASKAHIHAHTDMPILIVSPCGGGADFLAQAIHDEHNNPQKPFLTFNCLQPEPAQNPVPIQEQLKTLIESSTEGTLFLSHLEALPSAVQTHLANVILSLYDTSYPNSKLPHRPSKLIFELQTPDNPSAAGSLLQKELLFTLSATTIFLVPLTQRMEDLYKIFGYFFCRYRAQKYAPADYYIFQNALCTYNWPGNLIQISAFAKYMAEIYKDTPLTATVIQETIAELYTGQEYIIKSPAPETEQETLAVPYITLKNKVLTLDYMKRILNKNNGNRTQAAKELGISRTSFWKCFQELENRENA